MKKLFIGVVILSLMFVFSSGPALASSATATATLGWSLTTGNIAWVGSDPTNDWSAAVASTVYGSANAFSVDPSTATIFNATATGQGTTSLSSFSFVGPVADAVPGFTQAESFARVDGTFKATANGVVQFTVPWDIAFTLVATAGPGAYAHGIATIDAVLTRYAVNGKIINQEVLEYISDTKDNPGTLVNHKFSEAGVNDFVKSSFRTGETGTISFVARTEVDAASVVPLPAGFWLIGSGLLGLVGIRRRSLIK